MVADDVHAHDLLLAQLPVAGDHTRLARGWAPRLADEAGHVDAVVPEALAQPAPRRVIPDNAGQQHLRPSVRALTPGLVAPPGTVNCSVCPRISTGASRETRSGVPR